MTTGSVGTSETAELPAPFVGSLSPSRASDFKTCPLLYRYRSIDHLPQTPSRVAARGTVVHAVLEELFDLPAAGRTLAAARAMVPAAWQRLLTGSPEAAVLFAADSDGSELTEWLDSAADLLDNYFALEDPTRLEPEAREQLVEIVVDGLRLRGYVDRLDVSPGGDIRVVDYKTGATPREAFEVQALFQMKFYALVLWRTRGVVPRQLRLIYLADTDTLTYSPDADELERFERTLKALWAAIERATRAADFQPSPSRLCGWCDFQTICPAFGGTPPPFPADAMVAIEEDHRSGLPAPITAS
jgi:putative RecB family exonuclease